VAGEFFVAARRSCTGDSARYNTSRGKLFKLGHYPQLRRLAQMQVDAGFFQFGHEYSLIPNCAPITKANTQTCHPCISLTAQNIKSSRGKRYTRMTRLEALFQIGSVSCARMLCTKANTTRAQPKLSPVQKLIFWRFLGDARLPAFYPGSEHQPGPQNPAC